MVRLRMVTALLTGLICASLVATPALAERGGNAENAARCRDGGYRNYTDAAGTPFRNAGHCTNYAAQGGTLVSTMDPDLSISGGTTTAAEGFLHDGFVHGSGFTPGSTITSISANYGTVDIPLITAAVNDAGNFSGGGGEVWWCSIRVFGFTTITVTVVSSADGTVVETFDLVAYCA